MKNRKTEAAITYCAAIALTILLTASMFAGCTIYEHEEIEIRRCPQLRDTITVPEWDERK